MVTQSEHQNKSLRADFGNWFFWAIFMGASGFVCVFDLLSSLQALEGNLFVIKILASSLGGVLGFVSAVRSGVFR